MNICRQAESILNNYVDINDCIYGETITENIEQSSDKKKVDEKAK